MMLMEMNNMGFGSMGYIRSNVRKVFESVVELKTKRFESEYVGKLNFYVNAVNDLIRTSDENPTIGLLICKDKDQTEVQWAFQGIQTPMGVASYDNIKIEEIKKQLPTEEQIQQRIELAEEEFNLSRGKRSRD